MGTYLSKPITDKESQDTENERMVCGASSMQGWREFQEDAHNCILDFEPDVSLFAVYDGHGGSEVAAYAAEHLPTFVKNDLYKKGDYEKALVKAFLDFDETLIEPSVVEKLTTLREERLEVDCGEEEEEDEQEELNDLYQEAELPISEILKKYKKRVELLDENKDSPEESNEVKDEQPGSSKVSPSPVYKSTSEVKVNDDDDDNVPSSSTPDDNLGIANGVSESNSGGSGGSSSSTKVNGSSAGDEDKTDESECGPSSSSKSQNGSGRKSGTARFISDDSDDESDDDDDEIYDVSTTNTNDESNSDEESAEDESEEDSDADLIEEEMSMDNEDEEEAAGKDSGCTAVVALLIKHKLYVANAGDSRCVVSVNGKAHDMSKDHKPEDEPELSRIHAAGGRVTSDGRVNGGLNLSRALGDHNYKKNTDIPNTEQMITALPDISVLDIESGNDNFLVLACDGIWNSLSSQEVIDFVSKRINKPDVKLSSICEELFDHCLAPNTLSDGTGCDNMTCVIVKLKHNSTKRSLPDDSNEANEGVECKKLKTNSTESETVC